MLCQISDIAIEMRDYSISESVTFNLTDLKSSERHYLFNQKIGNGLIMGCYIYCESSGIIKTAGLVLENRSSTAENVDLTLLQIAIPIIIEAVLMLKLCA